MLICISKVQSSALYRAAHVRAQSADKYWLIELYSCALARVCKNDLNFEGDQQLLFLNLRVFKISEEEANAGAKKT